MLHRRPVYIRMRARVPGVLYVNFLADRAYAERLAPESFRPTPWPTDPRKTLFTILLFRLQSGRPTWAPGALGRFTPSVWQSNWRFYGTLTSLPGGQRPGVLFWRTVTDSRLLTIFGLGFARCFPVQRAQRMEVRCHGHEVLASISPGSGAAPSLLFRGELTDDDEVPPPFQAAFTRFVDYARWVADQRLSLTVWPGDVVIQDMHLTLEAARFVSVKRREVSIPALRDFVEEPERPLSCFWAENLEVWLDSIRALPRR